jgi:hypothetical protein
VRARIGPGQANVTGLQVASRLLYFRFPDSDATLPPDDDDLTFTGPAAIAVTSRDAPLPCQLANSSCQEQTGMLACVDALFARDGDCGGVPDPLFPAFTALPPPNDFQAICSTLDSACTGTIDEMRFTIDAAGNMLVPMDWRGVQTGAGLPIASTVRLATTLEAFTGEGASIALGDAGPAPAVIGSFSADRQSARS